MTEDDLSDWLTPLISKLEPKARAALARDVARDLRRSQQQRIAGQRNPDGSPYAPRKLRAKQGNIKRKATMFTKLRTARYLKARGSAEGAVLAFEGRIARIARVHQLGLKDRPGRGQPDVQYAKRELLGFSPTDADRIRDAVLSHLTL